MDLASGIIGSMKILFGATTCKQWLHLSIILICKDNHVICLPLIWLNCCLKYEWVPREGNLFVCVLVYKRWGVNPESKSSVTTKGHFWGASIPCTPWRQPDLCCANNLTLINTRNEGKSKIGIHSLRLFSDIFYGKRCELCYLLSGSCWILPPPSPGSEQRLEPREHRRVGRNLATLGAGAETEARFLKKMP